MKNVCVYCPEFSWSAGFAMFFRKSESVSAVGSSFASSHLQRVTSYRCHHRWSLSTILSVRLSGPYLWWWWVTGGGRLLILEEGWEDTGAPFPQSICSSSGAGGVLTGVRNRQTCFLFLWPWALAFWTNRDCAFVFGSVVFWWRWKVVHQGQSFLVSAIVGIVCHTSCRRFTCQCRGWSPVAVVCI